MPAVGLGRPDADAAGSEVMEAWPRADIVNAELPSSGDSEVASSETNVSLLRKSKQ